MNRAEIRRNQREQSKSTKTYTLNQSQIDQIKKQAVEDAVDKAFFLMMALPCEVLANEGYWEKSARQRMPKFIDEILSLYAAFEQGVVTMEQMELDLWDIAGVRLERKKL
ncbi:hypothetical protein QA584_22760 [Anaerocolumna sp. AGMB13025]|uniref:hypothetical protein n=1 Tax=Anaerocolumna sp. AGMB13025 TaxID=3039116 RepID=UPI00241C550D|nr:hypothetical protein [Anaerocolumna sp. AGMB13025]WFR56406.1 hypothetical protein QA584_22760 [Anaerocolumna sp. AGMB13025]